MCSTRPPAIVSVSSRTVARTNGFRISSSRELRSRRRRSSARPARRARRAARSDCRAGRASPRPGSSTSRRPRSSGDTDSASASAASLADWISAALTRSETISRSPGSRSALRLADCGRARIDGDDVGQPMMLEREVHGHQLRDRRDRHPRVRVLGRASTSPVLSVSTRYAVACREADRRQQPARRGRARRGRARAVSPDAHLLTDEERRGLEPGLSCWMRLTETPVAVEITAKVSPAWTTQNFAVAWRRGLLPVVAATVPGASESLDEPPTRSRHGSARPRSSRPAETPPAPRSAARAAHYQPEAIQSSRCRRAASAPAAWRKSSPASRYA